jgi:hypothetical protein
MIDSYKKPILVTGSHRSGSTWAGKMLALSSDIAYIHEPFNINHNPGICKARFENWFPYIFDENENDYLKEIDNCLRFKYNLIAALKAIKSQKDLRRALTNFFQFYIYRHLKKRPLIKDPIAVFSTQWLAKRFDMDVVILIRHPAAFAGSLKKANWPHPFKHFIRQVSLVQNHLSSYKSEIEEFAKKEKDIVDQAILLWNLIHYMILKYRKEHPDWIFIKHEDLSENPKYEFSKLYRRLGIHLTAQIERKINNYTSANNNHGNTNFLKRDSKSNIWSWQSRLNDEEKKRIKARTHDIAKQFYTEEDWHKKIA